MDRRLAVLVAGFVVAGCSSSTSVRSGEGSSTTVPDARSIREVIQAWADERVEAHRDQLGDVELVIDRIELVGDDRAEIDLHMADAGETPADPELIPAGAVHEGGQWQVTRATDCFLDDQLGAPCQPDEFLTDEEQEIGKPFADLGRAELSDEERLAGIEGGEAIRDHFLDIVARNRRALGSPLRILAVRHRPGATEAQVWFSQSTIGPGTAVLEDGRWKVSQADWCQLTFNFTGEACPAGRGS